MPATGIDFTSLQVRDLDASQAFYERYLGLVRSPRPAARRGLPDRADRVRAPRPRTRTDLSAGQPALGVALWFHATDVQAIHDALVADGHTIVTPPFDGPFGRTFTFADPDGYPVTLHDRR